MSEYQAAAVKCDFKEFIKYYNLDIFDIPNTSILETNYDSNLILPSGINILEDITNNPEYYNVNMAKEKVKKLVIE